MQDVKHALEDVKNVFQQVMGQPAPHIGPQSYAPFPPGVDPRLHAIQEVEHLKKLAAQAASVPTPPTWTPRADTFLSEDAFVIRVEIPGVAREDLKVYFAGGECIVRGERKQFPVEMRPMTMEQPYGPFERRFFLPPGSHPEQLSAKFVDGILTLTLKIDRSGSQKEMEIEVE